MTITPAAFRSQFELRGYTDPIRLFSPGQVGLLLSHGVAGKLQGIRPESLSGEFLNHLNQM